MLYRLLGLMLLSLPTIAAAQSAPQTGAFVEGRDFAAIEPAQPTTTDTIEVIEAFGYSCGACASFQPHVNAWKAKLPADVAFHYMPAAWGGVWETYARAYYAAESLGVLERTHDALIKAIHVERKPLRSAEDIAAFYTDYGVSKDDFLATMNSFAVNAKIARSKQQLPRYGVEGTPTVVIAGKYRVGIPQEGGFERMLAIIDYLIAQERRARAG